MRVLLSCSVSMSPSTETSACRAEVERLAAAHPAATLLLVAHGGVLQCLFERAAGRRPPGGGVPNGALGRIRVEGTRCGGPRRVQGHRGSERACSGGVPCCERGCIRARGQCLRRGALGGAVLAPEGSSRPLGTVLACAA